MQESIGTLYLASSFCRCLSVKFPALKSSVLMLATIVTSVSSQDLGFGFTLKYVRMCLKPEFTRELAVNDGTPQLACAFACTELGASCQGFQLMEGGASNAQCRAFVFDRCSHMVRTDCGEFAWAYVRNHAGLPDGQLCPDGFGNGYFGSAYKIVSAANWTEGVAACELPGLTKYADASEKNETAHFHWIKTNVNSGNSFFIGGWRPGSSASDPWFWKDCDTSVLPEVWGTNQPNEGVPANRLDIWFSHTAGVDDGFQFDAKITKALCECVDPFV